MMLVFIRSTFINKYSKFRASYGTMAESLQKQAAVSESETEADSIGKKRPLDEDSSEGASGTPEDDGVNKRVRKIWFF